ncbi:hypothetical protein HDU85_000445 [Gaertneriomyces sp. JEL0708]|nr:hypothetical protein HDU85_000445 [Gaertneriomyces sp. JEL0708]
MVEHTFEWKSGGEKVVIRRISVVLTGDFCDWNSEEHVAVKGEDGVFRAKLERPEGTKILFKFIVDGDWKAAENYPIEGDDKNNVFVFDVAAKGATEEVDGTAAASITEVAEPVAAPVAAAEIAPEAPGTDAPTDATRSATDEITSPPEAHTPAQATLTPEPTPAGSVEALHQEPSTDKAGHEAGDETGKTPALEADTSAQVEEIKAPAPIAAEVLDIAVNDGNSGDAVAQPVTEAEKTPAVDETAVAGVAALSEVEPPKETLLGSGSIPPELVSGSAEIIPETTPQVSSSESVNANDTISAVASDTATKTDDIVADETPVEPLPAQQSAISGPSQVDSAPVAVASADVGKVEDAAAPIVDGAPGSDGHISPTAPVIAEPIPSGTFDIPFPADVGKAEAGEGKTDVAAVTKVEEPAEVKAVPVEPKAEAPIDVKVDAPAEAKPEIPAKVDLPIEAKSEAPVESKPDSNAGPAANTTAADPVAVQALDKLRESAGAGEQAHTTGAPATTPPQDESPKKKASVWKKIKNLFTGKSN